MQRNNPVSPYACPVLRECACLEVTGENACSVSHPNNVECGSTRRILPHSNARARSLNPAGSVLG